MSVLGTRLYQYTNWHCCERLHLDSVNFLEDSFNTFAHFMMGDLQTHLPTTLGVQQCLTPKWHDPHTPPSLFTWFLPKWLFCLFSRWKKSSEGNILLMWNRWKKKNNKHEKTSKSMSSKTVLSSGKKCLNSCTASNESTLKVTEV